MIQRQAGSSLSTEGSWVGGGPLGLKKGLRGDGGLLLLGTGFFFFCDGPSEQVEETD